MFSVGLKVSILWVIGLSIATCQTLRAADRSGDETKTPSAAAPVTPAPGAEKPQADSTSQAKSATMARATDPKELKRTVAEVIDTLPVSDLKKKMARVQAVLGLEGQAILKDRATLRRESDRLAAELKELAQDAKILDVEALLANNAFRNELSQAQQIGDKKEQAAAIMEILRKNHIDVVSLKKVVRARNVKAEAELCDDCLAGAESQLDALQSAARSAGKFGPDDSHPSRIADLALRYGGKARSQHEVPPDVSADDLTAVLKALLTAPSENSKPSP